MSAYLNENPKIASSPLFTGAKGGRLPRASLRKAWLDACAISGYEDFHLHDLRHIGLTLVSQAGASLKDVQNRGGHASTQAAMRYQHSSEVRDAEVVQMADARAERLG